MPLSGLRDRHFRDKDGNRVPNRVANPESADSFERLFCDLEVGGNPPSKISSV